jgi:hypothetical protein
MRKPTIDWGKGVLLCSCFILLLTLDSTLVVGIYGPHCNVKTFFCSLLRNRKVVWYAIAISYIFKWFEILEVCWLLAPFNIWSCSSRIFSHTSPPAVF